MADNKQKVSAEMLNSVLAVFKEFPEFVTKAGKDALLAAGLIEPTARTGKQAESVNALLMRFADGDDISTYLLRRLTDAKLVTVTDKVKSTPGSGRASYVYGLTGTGKSRVALLTRNRDRAAAKAAGVAAVVAPAVTNNNETPAAEPESDQPAEENAPVEDTVAEATAA